MCSDSLVMAGENNVLKCTHQKLCVLRMYDGSNFLAEAVCVGGFIVNCILPVMQILLIAFL